MLFLQRQAGQSLEIGPNRLKVVSAVGPLAFIDVEAPASVLIKAGSSQAFGRLSAKITPLSTHERLVAQLLIGDNVEIAVCRGKNRSGAAALKLGINMPKDMLVFRSEIPAAQREAILAKRLPRLPLTNTP